ncbi:hypothetical protein X798_03695 [Onchocerca flexuosa]|uniref:Uncharacterized protein n=1 Tax=Onchocerca flexuosa TaxID=387005 RepID=A0A238BVM9_9BILA|nr:hypothetical protein X798_03695 [Onchocerca flexuosa]
MTCSEEFRTNYSKINYKDGSAKYAISRQHYNFTNKTWLSIVREHDTVKLTYVVICQLVNGSAL